MFATLNLHNAIEKPWGWYLLFRDDSVVRVELHRLTETLTHKVVRRVV